VVADPAAIAAAVDKVAQCASGLGLNEVRRAASEVKGPKGNQEVFLHCAGGRGRKNANKSLDKKPLAKYKVIC